ncbi:Polyketide cyclase / dehydrase and lipid transport [Burkholderiales bacterium JOSHI_001]|nr:Polyketide cyclase / dehydrase and lipid transport [Burkholderiales bacterium JOSHI_001]
MKWFKVLLAGAGALALVLGGGGMLLPSGYQLSRSVEVAAAPDKVYALVAQPRAWKRWSAWNLRDPFMAIEYSGPDSGLGAAWSWRSASEGKGRMHFTAAQPGQHLAFDLYFVDFNSSAHGEFNFQPTGTGTRVTWSVAGDYGPNPLLHWLALVSDRLIGPDFQAGLDQLKVLAETH